MEKRVEREILTKEFFGCTNSASMWCIAHNRSTRPRSTAIGSENDSMIFMPSDVLYQSEVDDSLFERTQIHKAVMPTPTSACC